MFGNKKTLDDFNERIITLETRLSALEDRVNDAELERMLSEGMSCLREVAEKVARESVAAAINATEDYGTDGQQEEEMLQRLHRDNIGKELLLGLTTDGAHHKQHCLETVFRMLRNDEYVDKAKLAFKWKAGIPG